MHACQEANTDLPFNSREVALGLSAVGAYWFLEARFSRGDKES